MSLTTKICYVLYWLIVCLVALSPFALCLYFIFARVDLSSAMGMNLFEIAAMYTDRVFPIVIIVPLIIVFWWFGIRETSYSPKKNLLIGILAISYPSLFLITHSLWIYSSLGSTDKQAIQMLFNANKTPTKPSGENQVFIKGGEKVHVHFNPDGTIQMVVQTGMKPKQ